MTMTLTTADQSLREAVMRQLEWEPDLDASMVAITTQGGITTISGYVDTYAAKLAAERAVRKVFGVKAIANELEVKLSHERIDPELARDAFEALKNHLAVPPGVNVAVRDGFITLTGMVEWMYQKVAAEKAVKYLRGVRGVLNHIGIKPKVMPKDVQKRIVDALHRHADLDARRIDVDVQGSLVVLHGNVRSWREKDEVVRAAWAAPGVTAVDCRLNIIP